MEMKDDARVLACRFPLPNWKPTEVIEEGIDSVWLYQKPNPWTIPYFWLNHCGKIKHLQLIISRAPNCRILSVSVSVVATVTFFFCHLSVNFLSDVIPFYNFHISYLHITNSSSCSTSVFQNHANPIYETINEPWRETNKTDQNLPVTTTDKCTTWFSLI